MADINVSNLNEEGAVGSSDINYSTVSDSELEGLIEGTQSVADLAGIDALKSGGIKEGVAAVIGLINGKCKIGESTTTFSFLIRHTLQFLAASFTLFFICVSVGSANSLSERGLCSAMSAWLKDSSISTPLEAEMDGCILMENVILYSDSWPQFVSNFKRYIGEDDYPLWIWKVSVAINEGNYSSALLYLDVSFESLLGVLNRLEDHRRKEIYIPLFFEWRVDVLEAALGKTEITVELRDMLSKKHRQSVNLTVPAELFLICLIRTDPLISDFRLVYKSEQFKKCITMKG